MQVKVIQRVSEIQNELVADKIAVIIDVFRASSVIVSALAHGVRAVITTSEIDEALREFAKLGHENCLLGGERNSIKIEGFHFGNSPLVYKNNRVKDKILILTTTNGTKAIDRCRAAAGIYICSLLNCSFIALALAKQKKDLVIICAGTNNAFSLEDAYGAGMLLFELAQYVPIILGDFEIALKSMYVNHQRDAAKFLAHSVGYQILKKNGEEKDIHFCLQKNIYPVLARKINDRIVV